MGLLDVVTSGGIVGKKWLPGADGIMSGGKYDDFGGNDGNISGGKYIVLGGASGTTIGASNFIGGGAGGAESIEREKQLFLSQESCQVGKHVHLLEVANIDSLASFPIP